MKTLRTHDGKVITAETCQKDHIAETLEAIEDLVPSQRSTQRHRCAACAYERGFQTGLNYGLKEIARLINKLRKQGE